MVVVFPVVVLEVALVQLVAVALGEQVLVVIAAVHQVEHLEEEVRPALELAAAEVLQAVAVQLVATLELLVQVTHIRPQLVNKNPQKIIT